MHFSADYTWLTFGALAATAVTFLLIVITHTAYHYIYDRKKEKHAAPVRKPDESLTQCVKRIYSKEHLNEIAKCALLLDNFDKGDGSDVSHKPLQRPKIEVDAKQDSDQPCPQEYEEIDIYDLLSDDIVIEEEEAEDDSDVISPQAMADIEAEMLNTSMLSSGSQDNEETDEKQKEATDDLEEKTSIEQDKNDADLDAKSSTDGSEDVLYEEEVVVNQALRIANSAVTVALSELGMESLIRGAQIEENLTEAEQSSKNEKQVFEATGDGASTEVLLSCQDLVASCLVRKAIWVGRKEYQDEKRLIDMCGCGFANPGLKKNTTETTPELSKEEMVEEKRTQENQLSHILKMMQEHPDLFGNMQETDMVEQASLYCP